MEPYAYLRDLFTGLARGRLAKDIGALMTWAQAPASQPSQRAQPGLPTKLSPSA